MLVKRYSSSADIYFRFKYIVVLDIDEVIVPQKHGSWSEMMEEVLKAKKPETISWHFRHTYFIDSMTEKEVESKMERDESESNNVKSSELSLQPDISSHLHSAHAHPCFQKCKPFQR